ncbi:zinc ribbon domain-containing protein [Metallibacterium scheffleri]|uniref:zinc ribbon domain-containing protein n=1 Tax=Metallibacterium scheffleri TaxID=993689 RepID=UPI003CCDF7BD
MVNERNTTRACSSCGQHTGPSGLRQLVVREWTCECGVTHDRDINAARNILRLGCEPPSAGTRYPSPSPPSQQANALRGRISEDDG